MRDRAGALKCKSFVHHIGQSGNRWERWPLPSTHPGGQCGNILGRSTGRKIRQGRKDGKAETARMYQPTTLLQTTFCQRPRTASITRSPEEETPTGEPRCLALEQGH